MGGVPRKKPQLRKKDGRVSRARQLRRAMTDAERKLWWHLRELKIGSGHFRRQATIGPYFADFACHESKLVIEVDGSGHMESQAVVSDQTRTRFLEAHGYRVLRFWNTDVLTNPQGVMTVIVEALAEAAAPHPLPLPTTRKRARGEGNSRQKN